jgi:iron complex transport system ATP-binding protein
VLANCLEVKNLSAGYEGRAVMSKLNLSAGECEIVALIGRNGAGKSTLMRTIARLQPAIAGDVLLNGKPVGKYTRSDLAGLLSIVSTEPVNVPHLTVRQLVALGRFPHTNWIGKLTGRDMELIDESVRLVDIKHLEYKYLHEISDGERQRAMIARALAQDTRLILLDEPTAFLDMPTKYEIVRLLRRLTYGKKKTIVFATHDLNVAMQEADKLWLIADGAICEGAPEDMALNGKLNRVFEGTKLRFDDRKGEFGIEKAGKEYICLSGEGKTYFWTRKALERLGFLIDEKQHHTARQVVISKNPLSWEYLHGDEKISFQSIYDLSQYLSECSTCGTGCDDDW